MTRARDRVTGTPREGGGGGEKHARLETWEAAGSRSRVPGEREHEASSSLFGLMESFRYLGSQRM